MPEIPEKLKWYQPLGLAIFNGPLPWRVSVDEMSGIIEIKRAPLVKAFPIIMGICFGVVIGGVFWVIYSYAPVDEEVKFVLVGCMIFFPLLMILGFPAVDALITVSNSSHWKGTLRFRYSLQNGELFFPRENMTYRREDYSKIVLGCARGTEMKGAFKKLGVWMKPHGRGQGLVPTTQIFLLVLDKNDEWKRYNLSRDWVPWSTRQSGSKSFMKVANCLRSHLEFEEFVKDYSQDECFAQQNDQHDGTGNKVLWQ